MVLSKTIRNPLHGEGSLRTGPIRDTDNLSKKSWLVKDEMRRNKNKNKNKRGINLGI